MIGFVGRRKDVIQAEADRDDLPRFGNFRNVETIGEGEGPRTGRTLWKEVRRAARYVVFFWRVL